MDLYGRIVSKEEINKRFITAVTAIMVNRLISSKTGLAESLGVKPAKFSEILNGRMNVGIDMVARMCDYYDVSPDWLLLSRGNNVFRQVAKQTIWIDDDNLNMKHTEDSMSNSTSLEEPTIEDAPYVVPISPAEESIIYKMYKDEKDEKERMLKEKDILLKDKESKIDHLQSELRSMAEELATYRAKYSPSNDIPLAFTPGSSEGYTPSSDTTIKPPKSSKRSSAGKM